jgi:hypothetical protein
MISCKECCFADPVPGGDIQFCTIDKLDFISNRQFNSDDGYWYFDKQICRHYRTESWLSQYPDYQSQLDLEMEFHYTVVINSKYLNTETIKNLPYSPLLLIINEDMNFSIDQLNTGYNTIIKHIIDNTIPYERLIFNSVKHLNKNQHIYLLDSDNINLDFISKVRDDFVNNSARILAYKDSSGIIIHKQLLQAAIDINTSLVSVLQLAEQQNLVNG